MIRSVAGSLSVGAANDWVYHGSVLMVWIFSLFRYAFAFAQISIAVGFNCFGSAFSWSIYCFVDYYFHVDGGGHRVELQAGWGVFGWVGFVATADNRGTVFRHF